MSSNMASSAAEHDSSLPRRHSRTHHSTLENPHLQVLGRDGRDLPLFSPDSIMSSTAHLEVNGHHTTTTNTKKKHWWDGMATRWTKHKEDEDVSLYASLDGNTNTTDNDNASTAAAVPTTSERAVALLSRNVPKTPTATTNSARSSPTTMGAESTTSSTLYASAAQSEEDLIRQDCSFFYRDLDEAVMTRKTPLKDETILSPQHRSYYKARYQQLNQDYHVDNDLEFFESDSDAAPEFPRVIQNFSHSSLYYKQDGRVLMKLPKDKMRLVMDPELGEPGILSAILDGNKISYILTVSPDLYQKVVLELAHQHTTWTSSIFRTQEKVGMHVAVVLLGGVLLILFFITLKYPGD